MSLSRVPEGSSLTIKSTNNRVELIYEVGEKYLAVNVNLKNDFLLVELKDEEGLYGPNLEIEFQNKNKLSTLEILAIPIMEYCEFFKKIGDTFNLEMMLSLMFDIFIRANVMDNFEANASRHIFDKLEGF